MSLPPPITPSKPPPGGFFYGATPLPSDANGVFSLPSGYLAITGETIQASQHNPVLEDIASSMSARLMRSGVAPMTGALKVVDGSVGSPAVQFNSASSTGIYKTTNGIGVSVGGTKVAEFTPSGISRMIGELIPWTLLSAPSGWVLPYGQTLSRTTYADLWAIAQTEISNGNTFYNNGNGTTTFGIGDLRGRTIAAMDNLGGSDSARNGGFAAALVMGGTAGNSLTTLAQANLPAIAPTFAGTSVTLTLDATRSDFTVNPGGTPSIVNVSAGSNARVFGTDGTVARPQVSGTYTPAGTISTLGSGTPYSNLQNTMFLKFILFAGA